MLLILRQIYKKRNFFKKISLINSSYCFKKFKKTKIKKKIFNPLNNGEYVLLLLRLFLIFQKFVKEMCCSY